MGQLQARWNAASDSSPRQTAKGHRPNPHAEDAPVAEATAVAPRRVVLLADGDGGEVEWVLAEYGGAEAARADLHADVQRFAGEHPGRNVAAEWQGRLGWRRFLLCKK